MDVCGESSAVGDRQTRSVLIDPAELRVILASLSQELERPLLSLRAGLELVLSGPSRAVCETRREHVTTMSVLCDELLCLSQAHLDYANLARDDLGPSVGQYTLSALIQEVQRRFHEVAAQRSIRLTCHLEGDDAAIETDACRVQRILGNLVENALRYTNAGGGVEVIGGLSRDGWFVRVADDGPGIPAGDCDRVFEPLYRLPRDEASGSEGKGLGLSICRDMVAQLGGTIRLESSEGVGTRVSIHFLATQRGGPGLSVGEGPADATP